MAVEEISKRFTLHDLFGYLLPGTLALLGIGGFAVVNDAQASQGLATLSKSFKDLHLSIQIVAFVACAYVCGLLSIGIGDLMYSVFGLRKRAPVWAAKGQWALSKSVKNELRKKLKTVVAEELCEEDQLTVAYSQLINAQKDGFVQLMSGRAAMFLGLAGAIILVTAFGALPYAISHWPEIGRLHCVCIITAFILGELWTLSKAYAYDYWWGTHVVFGYLALIKPNTETTAKND